MHQLECTVEKYVTLNICEGTKSQEMFDLLFFKKIGNYIIGI